MPRVRQTQPAPYVVRNLRQAIPRELISILGVKIRGARIPDSHVVSLLFYCERACRRRSRLLLPRSPAMTTRSRDSIFRQARGQEPAEVSAWAIGVANLFRVHLSWGSRRSHKQSQGDYSMIGWISPNFGYPFRYICRSYGLSATSGGWMR